MVKEAKKLIMMRAAGRGPDQYQQAEEEFRNVPPLRGEGKDDDDDTRRNSDGEEDAKGSHK